MKGVADITRGYVGRDLAKLTHAACIRAIRRGDTAVPAPNIEDFKEAQKTIHPSHVEFHTPVKYVEWERVAGFEELKVKLLQKIVWPIVHPDTFRKLGLSAPSGLYFPSVIHFSIS